MPNQFGQDIENYIDDIVDQLKQEEQRMMAIIKNNLAEGIDTPEWVENKTRNLTSMKKQLIHAQRTTSSKIYKDIDSTFKVAYEQGGEYGIGEQVTSPNKILSSKVKLPKDVQLMKLERQQVLKAGRLNILRSAVDGYRSVIEETASTILLGTTTSRQALQRSLNKFADKGITGFVDKAGRNWNLTTYTQMALRTSTFNASRMGASDRIAKAGLKYVIVTSHGNCCPLCAPYEAVVLALDGNDNPKGRTTLDDAIANGLFHPNCKHMIIGYVEGSTVVEKVPYDPEGYDQTQLQRYNESQIRKWKMRHEVALDPQTKQFTKAKISRYQASQRDLLKDYEDRTGKVLKRRYDREQVYKLGKGGVEPPRPKPKPVPKPNLKPKPVTKVEPKPKPKKTSKVPWTKEKGWVDEKARQNYIQSESKRLNAIRRTDGVDTAMKEYRKSLDDLIVKDNVVTKSKGLNLSIHKDLQTVSSSKPPVKLGYSMYDDEGKKLFSISRKQAYTDEKLDELVMKYRTLEGTSGDTYKMFKNLEHFRSDINYNIEDFYDDFVTDSTNPGFNLSNRLIKLIDSLETTQNEYLRRITELDRGFRPAKVDQYLGYYKSDINYIKNQFAKAVKNDYLKAGKTKINLHVKDPKINPAFGLDNFYYRDSSKIGETRMREDLLWFNKHCASLAKDVPEEIAVDWSTARAYAVTTRRTALRVSIPSSKGMSASATRIHELGHHFKDISKEKTRVIDNWYKTRIEGTKLSRGSEPYWKDHFFDTYIGRNYEHEPGKGTEVVSMGIQAMFENPDRFYKQDKDMFEIIYGVMQGLTY